MKLTFVSPRCGPDIVGGAEHAILMLAKKCVEFGGVQADILTTTAGDERTWSTEYKAGHDVVHGIDVQRFSNDPIDRTNFDQWSRHLLDKPESVTPEEFDQWLIRQGPYSPGLLEAISNSKSDAIVFHPMLSSPTSHGVFASKVPVVIHPAFHDEPLSRMPGYKLVANRADLLAFSTQFEQKLSQDLLDTRLNRQSVIGFGVDTPSDSEIKKSETIGEQFGITGRYAIVIGRVDPSKGTDLAFKMFEELHPHIKGIDQLVFVGPRSESSIVLQNDRVVVTGSIDDETKWALLKGAQCLISPSVTESFSLVVLEAMKLGVPVVVNGACGPTREHVARSGSGAYFTDASSFVAAVDVCSQDSDLRTRMIKDGVKYVDDFYDWEKLISRYVKTVELAASASTSE